MGQKPSATSPETLHLALPTGQRLDLNFEQRSIPIIINQIEPKSPQRFWLVYQRVNLTSWNILKKSQTNGLRFVTSRDFPLLTSGWGMRPHLVPSYLFLQESLQAIATRFTEESFQHNTTPLISNWSCQKPMSRSVQLPHIPVTAFSWTD